MLSSEVDKLQVEFAPRLPGENRHEVLLHSAEGGGGVAAEEERQRDLVSGQPAARQRN